jgi:hypothetical protein
LATKSVATVPCSPGVFSTTTGLPASLRKAVAVEAHDDVGAGARGEVADRADLARRVVLRRGGQREQEKGLEFRSTMNNISRRVAILGGARIPFARANTVYAESSNQDMLTAH